MKWRQRGIALVLVLWVTLLLSVIVGSFTLVSRVETLTARNLLDSTRAHFAAQAGLHYAVSVMSANDPEQEWVPDGRDFTLQIDDATVEISVVDESGRIDLNAAQREQLVSLFESVTEPGPDPKRDEPEPLDPRRVEELADAILDWRDPDDLVRLYGAEAVEYERVGYPYGPRNGPFASVEELQQVMGMNYELYRQVEPAVTVYSGRSEVNLAYAPRQVLLAQPGVTPDLADRYITEREQTGADGLPPLLPGTAPTLARGGSVTYSIESRAALPNGASSTLEAVVRLRPTAAGRPFSIVRWKENDFSSDDPEPTGPDASSEP